MFVLCLSNRRTDFYTTMYYFTGELQDLSTLASYMSQYTEEQFLQAVSDFNVLYFLCNCDVLPLREHMAPLLAAVKTSNVANALQWSHGEQWSTMQHLLQASGKHIF